jgi:N-acetyltransferase
MNAMPHLLEGQTVKLVPMSLEHVEDLYRCGQEEIIWTYLPKRVTTVADMREVVEAALKMKEAGLDYPFVVYDKERNEVIGSTRYLTISYPNRNLEIGWTWYAPSVWRTRVNTECKYLLLKFAFEEFKALRVQLKADTRNARSNQAIERIGAKREGEIRQDRILSDGYVRNAFMYSIIDSEWQQVKERLERYLNV